MQHTTTRPPLPGRIDDYAYFFDFDGTLVEIAPRPDQVRLEAQTRQSLASLKSRVGAAVAIVTGREISVIDTLLSPLHLPVAGVHGLMRRDANGRMHEVPPADRDLGQAADMVDRLAGRHDGLLVERKSRAVALHFRARPDCAPLCHDIMRQVVET
ncbi:MAG: trehalose-phosphatase, partial [Hyphomicrobiaceae bacterium]